MTRTLTRLLPCTILYSLLGAGCYTGADADDSIADSIADSGGADEAGTDATDESGGVDESGGAPDTSDESGAPPPGLDCADPPRTVGRSPLRRLTRGEYVHTVRDLLGDESMPVDLAIIDNRSGSGFAANDLTVDALSAEGYHASAETIAGYAITNLLPGLTTCSLDDATCMQAFVQTLAASAWRRPLTPAEAAALAEFHATGVDQWGAEQGLQAALQVVLSSPNFLYHLEVGEPDPADPSITRLTAPELASRLSYFLWQSMPDPELRALADSGELHDPDVLADQARRMLGDDRALRAIGRFHEEWLYTDMRLTDAYKDTAVFPQWTADLEASMRKGLREFARHVILQDDARFATLLAAPYTFADADLAAIYGLPAPEGFSKLDTDPGERRGILAQAAFLAGHAHASEASWVQRGLFVRSKLLCTVLPGPPDNVDMTDLNNPDRTDNPACSGCHLLMDPIGQGMDNFDAIGRHLAGDGPAPGKVEGHNLDAAGEFAGLSELALRLADSRVAQDCMATHWFRYATRRLEEKSDDCTLTDLLAKFADTEGDLRELMVEIAVSDGFRLLRRD
jgi:hypothetical protein